MSDASGLLPASLRFRFRLVLFVALLVGVVGLFIRPLTEMLAQPARIGWGLLGTSALVLGLVVGLVLVAEVVARRLSDVALGGLDALTADLHRATVAEGRGRRGDHFLTPRTEAVEVRHLRTEVRALHHVLQERRLADQAWLGASVHDVKAGLAGLAHLLDAEVGRRGAAGTDAAGGGPDLVDAARSEARRLSWVLTTMVGYLRTARSAPERSDEVDLALAARRAVEGARRHRPEIDVGVDVTGVAHVLGDRTLLEQAVANLVDNAVRIARSRVRVTVYPGVVRVEDDGPGLPAELTSLTDPFASGPDGDGRRGSLGLGLYIAHRVLEGHDGGLTVERSDAGGTVLLAYVGRAV